MPRAVDDEDQHGEGALTAPLNLTMSVEAPHASNPVPRLPITRSRSAPGGMEIAAIAPPPLPAPTEGTDSVSVSDGCWERARRRNFVLLRGLLALCAHFGIGLVGYLPFKDDFDQQHNATLAAVDAFYFSAGG